MGVSSRGRRRKYKLVLLSSVVFYPFIIWNIVTALLDGDSTNLLIYLFVFLSTSIGLVFTLRNLRTTEFESEGARDVRADGVAEDAEEFPIRGGRCTVTDEVLLIETDLRTFLQQLWRKRSPLLVLAAVTSLVTAGGLLVVMLSLISVILGFSGVVPRSVFDAAIPLTAASAGILVGSVFVWSLYWSAGMRWSQRTGEYPEKVSSRTVISRDAIGAVSTTELLGRTALFVHYTSEGKEQARPVYLLRDADEIGAIRRIFEKAGVPFESEASVGRGEPNDRANPGG